MSITVRRAENDDDIIAIHRFLSLVARPVLHAPIDPIKSIREIERVVRTQWAVMVWQFYGDAAKQTIARQQPASSSLPSTNLPPSPEIAIEQPSPPAVQRSAQEAVAAQAATDPTVPAVPSFKLPSIEALQLETIARNLAAVRQNVEAVRQNVEQLAAGQEQMVRDIAKLQKTEQDIRHMISAPPSRPTAPPRKPVPAVAGPPKSSAAPLTSALGH